MAEIVAVPENMLGEKNVDDSVDIVDREEEPMEDMSVDIYVDEAKEDVED